MPHSYRFLLMSHFYTLLAQNCTSIKTAIKITLNVRTHPHSAFYSTYTPYRFEKQITSNKHYFITSGINRNVYVNSSAP